MNERTQRTPGLTSEQAIALVRPLAKSSYAVDYPWASIERALQEYEDDYGLNLNPDFQRGHVWTQEQQVRYIENVYRGVVQPVTMVIQFNAPHWDDFHYDGELPREIQILDGLQRLTAVRQYLSGNIRPFGKLVHEFDGTEFSAKRTTFYLKFAVHQFKTRVDLLQHYLDLNTGGTPHSETEIIRVKGLLDAQRRL